MARRGPLAESYAGAAALVVLTLVPFLLLTAAVLPVGATIAKQVGLSTDAFDLTVALSDGAYALGTVLAVQFAVHLPTRRMLLVYVSSFTLAAVLAAWAPAPGVFVAAIIVEGLCTSLMLIAAVPPLVTGWPAAKMPVTGAVMNLCIFGAVAAGPSVGALCASLGVWRPLFWGVAGVGGLALVLSLLTFEDTGPSDPSAPWDILAVALAAFGCGSAFFGAGELEVAASPTALALVPLISGFVMIVALVVYQYRARRPLMPMRAMTTSFPVAGITIAMFASAAAFGLMDLVLTAVRHSESPGTTALVFLPELAAAFVTAGVFGLLFRTRLTPVLAVCGTVATAAAAALGAGLASHAPTATVAATAGLVGLGVGAAVSPALFVAGFSLRSSETQRVFALVELLRGVTAFLVAPVLVFVAESGGPSGFQTAMWVCCATAVAGGVLAVAVLRAGGVHLQVPDLDGWQEEDRPAWESPPLLSAWGSTRRRAPERAAGGETGNDGGGARGPERAVSREPAA